MLVHNSLFDPIRRTERMRPEQFLKYVEINQQAGDNRHTAPDMVGGIRDIFYGSHPTTDPAHLDRIWAFIEPKVEMNPGLAQFILDYGGARSSYFFPWLIEVATSPSGALEMAYNAGQTLEGTWQEYVPEFDDINYFVRNDPTFVYNRERQMMVADLVSTIGDKASPEHPAKVLDFGAGRMAWARWHGYEFTPDKVEILAFDRDPSIDPAHLFPWPLDELNLTYTKGDMMAGVTNPACREADFVLLGGVASYYPMPVFTEAVVAPIHGLLNQGGVFFFDLQLDCPYLRRSMQIFDWPELELRSLTTAIDAVEQMRKTLWLRGQEFEASYSVDTYNETPSSVMVTFTKTCL